MLHDLEARAALLWVGLGASQQAQAVAADEPDELTSFGDGRSAPDVLWAYVVCLLLFVWVVM